MHIYRCTKNLKKMTNEKIKFEFISYNYPVISSKNVIFDEYVIKLKSLPDIKKDYNINYKNIIFLLDYYNIKKRTSKNSSKLISTKKYKKTVLNKYGVDNVSKLQSIKEKKLNLKIDPHKKMENYTNIQNFFNFKDNFFDSKKIDENVKKDIFLIYKNSYKHWEELSDEQKSLLIDKSHSLLETRITNCLDKLSITYVKKFMIGRKIYDLKIKNIILEVNSDLWHANPVIYKSNDVIDYYFKKIKAKTIWKKDLMKKIIAEDNKYKFFVIWENDIKNLSDDDIIKYLINDIFIN